MPYRALALALTLLAAAPAPAHAAPDRTKPTVPGSLRVTATTTTSATLAWNASTDNSGSVSYVVRESAGTTRTAATTNLNWTGLTPGRTYRFTVSAVDPSGNRSAESNPALATTPATPPPAVPTNVRLTAATPSTLTFAWDAVSGATRYEVLTDGSGQGNAYTNSYTILWGLAPDTSHTFAVRSVSSSGVASPFSARVTARTLRDTTAPTAPAVTGSASGYSSAHLTWAPSTDDSNYVSYNVYVDGRPSPQMLPPGPTSMDVLNLRDGTTYDLSVAAYDASGNLSPATHVSVTTPESPDTTPPPAPGGLTAMVLNAHAVRLGWGGAADAFAYEVWMDGAFKVEVVGDWRYAGMLIPAGDVRHLAPGSAHTFTARARDEAGNLSAPSNAVTVTLPASTDTTPPAAPTNLWASASPGCAFADFMWSGEPDVEIYEDGLYLDTWRTEVLMTSFGRHAYTLRAVDAAGNTSPDSTAVILDHGNRC